MKRDVQGAGQVKQRTKSAESEELTIEIRRHRCSHERATERSRRVRRKTANWLPLSTTAPLT